MEPPRYEERQTFAVWAFALIAISEAVIIAAVWWAWFAGELGTRDFGLLIAMIVVLEALICMLLRLRTRLYPDRLEIQLGFLPLLRKRIPLKEIRDARVVTYRPVRDAGGWGWRWGRFDGHFCTFLNARGNRGVYLDTTRGAVIVGSQKPEELLARLREVLPAAVK